MKTYPALCICLLLAGSTSLAQTPAIKPVLTAVVTDSEGRTTTVTDLVAIYAFNTYRSGDVPVVDYVDALVFQLEAREGRVTTTDVLRLPFAGLRRFRLPGNFRVEIEQRDGSSLVLDQITGSDWKPDTQRKLEEKGPDGSVRKTTVYYEYAMATTKQDGEILGAAIMKTLKLSGLRGKARTASGREGEFGIGINEVKEVEFK